MGGFRPFTEYTCAIVATNSQGSGPPATDTTMTNEDGECSCITLNYIIHLLLKFLHFIYSKHVSWSYIPLHSDLTMHDS